MNRDVALPQQNNHTEAAFPHETSSTKIIPVQLVPDVIERIFSYVSPADNVTCHVTHWLISSIACFQLHNRLAVPKNGVFLLKWPLCFHNREDAYPRDRQYRYTDLLRYNVSLSGLPSSIIVDHIQIFLAGFETMILAEVDADAAQGCYSSLNTFVADFSLLRNFRCTDEQTVPFQKRDAIQQETHKTLLFCDWQTWAQTINAVIDSCAAFLSNFLFLTHREQVYPNFRVKPSRLPAQLYRGLNFDLMLTKMRNLHMLYMPITDYEKAFDHQPKCEIWRLVRQVPQTEFLPLLQRMFELQSFCLYDEHEITDDPAKSSTRLALPRASGATLFSTKLHITPSKSESPCLALMNVVSSYVGQPHLPLSDGRTENEFTTQILQFVNSAETVRERRERLSVWGGKVTTKAHIVLDISRHFQFEPVNDLPSVYLNITKALAILLDLLRAKKIHPSAVRISVGQFTLSRFYRFYWDRLRQILPFFVAGAVEHQVLRAFRIRLDTGNTFSTFSEQLKHWHEFTKVQPGVNDDLLFQQQYKLPGITLCVNKLIEIHANHVTAENWIESIEQAVMQHIRVFVCDAVDSCVRRDLSFYLYESLKRVDYSFHIQLFGLIPAVTSNWRDEEGKQFLERIRLRMQSRAAKFDERVAREVFAEVLKTADDGANDILSFAWTIQGELINHTCN